MPQDNTTKQLIINQLTKEQYNELVNNSQLSNSELYIITDDNHYTEAEIITLLSKKQNILKVGEGVSITEEDVISIDLNNIYTKEELNLILANKSDITSTGYLLDYNDNVLSLRDINGSILSYVTIKTTLKTDNITVSYNENEDLQSIGEITKNGTPKYTWIGTQEEYDRDFENGIIDEYTECLIVDTEAENITPIVQFEAPTKLSELANDMDFATNSVVQEIKSELEAKIGEPIDDNNLVHKTGTETINGFKTFTEEITIQNGNTKGRISHKNTTSDTPSITDGYIEFGENTLKYGKESEQGLLYHTSNDIFHSGNLVAGENIALVEKDGVYTINGQAGGGTGGTTVFVDDETIVKDAQQTITAIGVKSKNDTILYDWVGTLEEYNAGISDGSIQSNWVCWITDDSINDLDFNNKANVDLDNLSEVGQNKFDTKANKVDILNKSQITNCITEIPQNIKLELNDGMLTLKAGSKVIVPNGAGVFDEVEITSDLTHTTTANIQMMLCVMDGNQLAPFLFSNCFSGPTAPTSTGSGVLLWFNTTDNKMKISKDSGASWTERRDSLPIAIVTANGTSYSSIDQVFNGMGYIGSTVWIDKGVKVLIANGRNEDGTLNNREAITNNVVTQTVASATNAPNHYIMIGHDGGIYGPTTVQLQYDEALNINTYQGNTRLWTIVGYIDITNGIMSNLVVKKPFRAVDYNEYKTNISTLNNSIDTLNNTKVNKAGDTMTGTLTVVRTDPYSFIAKSSVIDNTITPTGNQYIGIDLRDKNNVRLGWIGAINHSNGKKYVQIQEQNSIDGFYFPKCMTKATTTSTASNYRVACIIQNYVNGTSWYRVWSDGWIEQGGTATSIANNTTISFLKSFSSTPTLSFTNMGYNMYRLSNISSTSFTIVDANYNSNDKIGSWYACGY